MVSHTASMLRPVFRDTWALVLAGGDGLRLRSLTTLIAGDARPKQFCPMFGSGTLLEQTCRRARLAFEPARLAVLLTRSHARYYMPILDDLPARYLIEQPENRGTAPAILYGLLRLAREAPLGTVVILPSDHWVSDDIALMRHVVAACAVAGERPDLAVLLGIAATRAEVDYGWIEPGAPLPTPGLFRVRRFWEKPVAAIAASLLSRGCLWNSFVIVARIQALVAMIRSAVPRLAEAFDAIEPVLGTPFEAAAIERVYHDLASTNFSERVLASRPANLAVLPLRGVEWTDCGKPERVLATLPYLASMPDWVRRLPA